MLLVFLISWEIVLTRMFTVKMNCKLLHVELCEKVQQTDVCVLTHSCITALLISGLLNLKVCHDDNIDTLFLG